MEKLLFIGFGGFIGTCLRYLLATFMHSITKISNFPVGTLAVNVIGCFIMGFLAHYIEAKGLFLNNHLKPVLLTGILGGFTTFSAFGLETMNLLQEGAYHLAMLNVLLNVIIGCTFIYLGHFLSASSI